jgi:hypothetical protein
MEGTDIEIDFNLKPDPSSDASNSFHTTGTVVWCNEDMDCGYQSGIHFNLVDLSAQKQLTSFLDIVSE